MNPNPQILERMNRANPVPELGLIHDSDLVALTSLLDERRSQMTDLKHPTRSTRPTHTPAPRWRRPAWIFAAAVVVVLIAVGAIAILAGGSDDLPEIGSAPSITTPTSISPPTTQPVPATTTPTSAPTTTLPQPMVLGPPVIDTYIEDIAFDNAGDAWVTGWAGGEFYELFRWHDDVWSSVELPAEFSQPGAVRGAPDGSIWVTGEGGLARYDQDGWTVYRPEDNDCGPTLAIDTSGGVWAICPDTFMRIEDDELVRVEALGESDWGGWFVAAGPNGSVYNAGFLELLSFDGSTWSVQECPADGPSGLGCDCLLGVGPDGDVWTGLGWYGADGLIRFRGESLEPELVLGQADGAVDMVFTPDGVLWFAVPEYEMDDLIEPQTVPPAGVFRFDGTEWRRYTTEDGLNSNSAARVEVTPDGTLWVGAAIRDVDVGADGIPRGGNIGGGIDVYDPILDRFFPLGGES